MIIEISEESCGVYCIENILDNKKYIGKSTVKIKYRINTHVKLLDCGTHKNIHLQRAWNKHGKENFRFYILELCDKDDLSDREKYFIKKYNSINESHGYNLTEGGEGVKSNKKRILSEETKKKLSEIFVGKRTGKDNAFYGKKHSEESIKKISDSKKDFHKNISIKNKKIIDENLKKGRGTSFWTEESIEKIKNAVSGENSGTSKLKEIQVLEILKSKKLLKEIAIEYDVQISTISRIKSGTRWSHLKERYPELYV